MIKSYSYIIVCISLFCLQLSNVWQGIDVGSDFWEHAAVVKELSRNLWQPQNPIIGGHIPHAFFSPYTVLIAIISITTGLDPISSLTYFGFINLTLILFSLYRFIKSIFPSDNQTIATISLLFMLFFWGAQPASWSGFYHILTYKYILSYPSAFAFGLSLLSLSIIQDTNHSLTINKKIVVIILSTVVFITHPLTALFLFVGIISSIWILHQNSLIHTGIKSALIIVPSLILAWLWPYYDFVSLSSGQTYNFNEMSKELYRNAIIGYWPLLLLIFSIPYLFKNKSVRYLIVSMILLGILYVIAFLLKKYGFGRVIANIMFLGQCLMGFLVVDHFKKATPIKKRNAFFGFLSVLMIISISINFVSFKKAFVFGKKTDLTYYQKFSFLEETVPANAIILSDLYTSWIIPTFSGKVIPSRHPIYWVDDLYERNDEINHFFDSEICWLDKVDILKKRKPDYILINIKNTPLPKKQIHLIQKQGTIVHNKNQLILVQINPRKEFLYQ